MKRHSSLSRAVLLSAVLAAALAVTVGVKFTFYLTQMNRLAEDRFPKQRPSPSIVYARPLTLHPGRYITPDDLERELGLLRYRKTEHPDSPGTFHKDNGEFTLFTRSFRFDEKRIPSQLIHIKIENSRVVILSELESGRSLERFRLEPVSIARFCASADEESIYIPFEEIPPLLIRTIIAVEDRHFFTHHGVDFSALFRAQFVNVQKGQIIQGGSTITQQLAESLFAGRGTQLRRHIEELVLALILERKFTKEEILEAYINSAYLGQRGSLAVLGFGAAARHYFAMDLYDLRPQEIALLAGLLKGPSFYNPHRHPKRAVHRRNTVLNIMARERLILAGEAEDASSEKLTVVRNAALNPTLFPAYTDIVKRRLAETFSEKELCTRGLRIFTACDPLVQMKTQDAISEALEKIESAHSIEKGRLNTGVAVTEVETFELLAASGGRHAGFPGFNRAVDAARPVGSLIKPLYFLAALEQPEHFNLLTLLNDDPVQIDDGKGGTWRPQNFDRVFHGRVPLYAALSQSYNAAAVRLGMHLGKGCLPTVLDRFGINKKSAGYPAALLGAVSFSPLEMAGVYQVFASGGLSASIQVIRSVRDSKGSLIYDKSSDKKRIFASEPVFLLNTAMQKTVTEGTAEIIEKDTVRSLHAAGKTGTSSHMKDSWFAGFTGDKSAAVWVGNDDYSPTGLTGAQGALKIWEEIMARISRKSLTPEKPDAVKWLSADPATGLLTDEDDCETAVSLPFIKGYEPEGKITCSEMEDMQNSHPILKGLFK